MEDNEYHSGDSMSDSDVEEMERDFQWECVLCGDLEPFDPILCSAEVDAEPVIVVSTAGEVWLMCPAPGCTHKAHAICCRRARANGLLHIECQEIFELLNFPGAFCKRLGLTSEFSFASPVSITAESLQNGTVLELLEYGLTQGLRKTDIACFLVDLCNKRGLSSRDGTRSAIGRLEQKWRKLRGQKRTDYLEELFLFPASFQSPSTSTGTSCPTAAIPLVRPPPVPTLATPPPACGCRTPFVAAVSPLATPPTFAASPSSPAFGSRSKKEANFELYTTSVQLKGARKQLKYTLGTKAQLDKKVSALHSKLGRFSPHNVRRREIRAMQRIAELERENATATEQLAQGTLQPRSQPVVELEQVTELEQKITDLEQLVTSRTADVNVLKSTLRQTRRQLHRYKSGKERVDTKNTALSTEVFRLRQELQVLNELIQEHEETAASIQIENGKLQTQESRPVSFVPRPKGVLSDDLRQCVAALIGLEVSAENVGPVIGEVLSALDIPFQPSDLPSRQCAINIADEAAFLIKNVYSEKLQETESWGLNKDGTSRQKRKILTATISLADGSELPLGFKCASRETAEKISMSVQEDIQELAEVHSLCQEPAVDENSPFLTRILSKLTTLMGDRAANEKKANRLLQEWRDQVLDVGSDEEKSIVHSFYCMAHALLGFHSYTTKNFTAQEKVYTQEEIKLGRQNNGAFFRFGHELAVLRTVRLAADILGPVGDEKSGIRGKWLAFCRLKGIKSTVQSYKDNRFNGLFEVAAQVFHHRHHILECLSQLDKPNLKVKSVLIDLSDERIRSMLHAVATAYLHITGPYWDVVNSRDIQYLHLCRYIQPLAHSLQSWKDAQFSTPPDPIFPGFRPDVSSPLFLSAQSPPECTRFFTETLTSIADGINTTIQNQLADFMPDGKYGADPAPEELERTKHCRLTNLTCERQFGSLDSSQNRRRHATLHYHSTVNIVKTHMGTLKGYLSEKDCEEKRNLWKKARKGGRFLRKKHQTAEKAELRAEEDDFQLQAAALVRKKSKQGKKSGATSAARKVVCAAKRRLQARRRQEVLVPVPVVPLPKLHDWVAVAYENGWYPGHVLQELGDEMYLVNFLHPASIAGQYKYPSRPDRADVKKAFVFASAITPPHPTSGGRIFLLQNSAELSQQYTEFSKRTWTA